MPATRARENHRPTSNPSRVIRKKTILRKMKPLTKQRNSPREMKRMNNPGKNRRHPQTRRLGLKTKRICPVI